MITAERLRELLSYCPDTGIFRWRVPVRGSRGLGGVAGHVKGQYQCICIDKISYRSHRLSWLHVYGRWPIGEIDHINCDGFDNRIKNLREATPGLNQANRTKTRRNTSGFKGVSRRSDGKAWVALIQKNGKAHHLGRFETREDAAAAYARATVSLNGEFHRL